MTGLRDPGAQPERTTLAWNRTTLSLVIAGLLCVRLAPSTPTVVLATTTVLGAISLQLHRTLRRHPSRTGHHPADSVSALLMTTLTILLAVIGMLFALE